MGEQPKPDCYNCVHRGTLPGDAHSRCLHPSAAADNPIADAFAILASVGRAPPSINKEGAQRLNVMAHPHGIRNGWFNWPYNFDPVWLTRCDGFTPKDEPAAEQRDG